MKSIKLKIGQKITVKVGGKEYLTIIDKNGTQRFKENKLLRHLVDSEMIDLNKLADHYQNKKCFTKREYAEFYMQIGYSVCGFSELSLFESYNIENPVWDED